MIDRVMLNGVAYAVTVANNPLPDDKVITVDGVQYIVGEPIVEAISEGGGVVGSIDKVVVNGNIYDIQDVEDVARETERAKQAEKTLSNAIADIKRNAMHYDTLGVNVYPDKAAIYGRSINTTPREVEFPAATHEKAGVMSAEDKAKLDNLSKGGGGGDITAVPTDVVIEEIEPNLVSTAIRKTLQVLTDSEKEIARGNIGAAGFSDLNNAIAEAITNTLNTAV